jgi:TolB protein
MNTKFMIAISSVLAALAGGAFLLTAQQPADVSGVIRQGEKPSIAVPDFRGSGPAQGQMDLYNSTLWDVLSGSGVLTMKAKSMYPLSVPQRPQDFKAPTMAPAARRGDAPKVITNGPWLTDWSGPPVSASYLAFGYTGEQDGRLVLYGWLYNLAQQDLGSAQVIGKLYYGSLDAEGAKKVAREFAADILQQFGAKSLAGSKIWFESDRNGGREIFSMDYDGSNQRQFTHYKDISEMPAVSADGKMIAFTSYAKGNPKIMVYSTETGKQLQFYNPIASMNATPEFSPDGKRILFSSTFSVKDAQIFSADLHGGDLRRISNVRAIEVSPRINPKTGTDMLFISGRSGHQQLWRMNIDGGDAEMLTTNEGDVSNPSWNPNGQTIAFAWTRGYEIGGFNIFVMDIAKRVPIQLTKGGARYENPWWAPDGVHLVYTSKRGPSTQIYTMLADGTNVQQLTTQGNNLRPVWVKGLD